MNQVGSGMPVYRGSTSLQRGYGLGGLLGGLFRSAIPLLKKGAAVVGKEALKAGADIAQDVMKGQNVRASAKKRLKSAGQNLGTRAINKIKRGTGSKRGKKRGGLNQNVISRAGKRRRKTYEDIFG